MKNIYTNKELETKVSELEKIIEEKKRKRTELSQSINNLRKQVEYWKSLHTGQTKMF